MKFTNIAAISMMSLLMVACGGGGGDSSGGTSKSSSNPTTTPEAEVEAVTELPVVELPVIEPETEVVEEPSLEPDPDAIYSTTAELIASKSFLLEQSYELDVSFTNDENRDIYLSVCSEFTEGESGISVNYNSCLLRTSIEEDYAGTLSVSNDKDRLVMAIWYLDDIDNPRYEIWEDIDDSEEDKLFEVD